LRRSLDQRKGNHDQLDDIIHKSDNEDFGNEIWCSVKLDNARKDKKKEGKLVPNWDCPYQVVNSISKWRL